MNLEGGRKNRDDYQWGTYTDVYEKQLLNIMSDMPMIVDNFEEKNGELVFQGPALHENWREIYHQIHRLKVKSVFECGCGSGQHLINIKKTSPNAIVNGCDYSRSQIDLGYKYYNIGDYDFSKRLIVKDLTDARDLDKLGKHEFVFTQAVTMHLRYDKAVKFLLNMKELSTKYIFLIENLSFHNYNNLIEEVFPNFKRIIDKNKYCMSAILLEKNT